MQINKYEIINRFVEERRKICTQQQLAEIIGINPKNISAIETCKINPSFETFISMCVAINADVNYIIYGNKEK